MKLIWFALIISTLDIFIQFTNCQEGSLLTDPIEKKAYPKKIKKLHLINPRKFLKIHASEYKKRNFKKVVRNEGYTFFPAIINNQGVPDSPFFQAEQDIEPKVRVKKVLPHYIFTVSRGKRSVKNVDVKVENKNVTKVKKRNAKSKARHRATKNNTAKAGKSKMKNATQSKKVSKTKSKIGSANSTPRLKYTVKKINGRINSLGKGKRVQRRRPRNQRNTQRQGKKKSQKTARQGKKDSRRLIAGKDARIADYPYVVSIQKGGEHWCAGALVNQRLVITTANCIWKSEHVSRLRVRAGSRHADRGGQMAKIQEVMKHPSWSIRGSPDNDIAFILLDRNIKFSDKVHSLDLPNYTMLPAFDDAWVTSWGAERRDGIFENTRFTLQAYHTRLMDHAKCNNVTKRFGVVVSENFICLTQTGRRAPCTRDTGAPAVSDGVLWGLASWGIRKLCGTERFPAMFSYLASPSNMQFIMNATHYLMADQRYYPFPDRFNIKRVVTSTTAVGPVNEYNV